MHECWEQTFKILTRLKEYLRYSAGCRMPYVLLSAEAGSNRYCDLFRLYHNTMPPFMGPHRQESPVERLGVNLYGKNYLDLLYPTRHRITHILIFWAPMRNLRKISMKIC